jgi:hypothetical protein
MRRAIGKRLAQLLNHPAVGGYAGWISRKYQP